MIRGTFYNLISREKRFYNANHIQQIKNPYECFI